VSLNAVIQPVTARCVICQVRQVLQWRYCGRRQMRDSCPGHSTLGGAKQPYQKYFDFCNDHKSEFDEWANSSISQVRNRRLCFCHTISCSYTHLAYLLSWELASCGYLLSH